MKRGLCLSTILLMTALLCNGCLVAKSTYLEKVGEANTLADEVASLTTENNAVKKQLAAVTGQRDELDSILQTKTDDLSKKIEENLKTIGKLDAHNALLKKEVNELEANNSHLRAEVAELEAGNTHLKKQMTDLIKKSQEMQSASHTYEELIREMKAEIAQGEVTITELKGKLTMDVVDKILFASAEATVKKEGLAVLKRVVDILKNVTDKIIRIEGHTDNVPIASRLAKIYPTNWELSAARALNVTRYLQEQGIDPAILSATAFGKYQPVADNSTPEGRAKNRRITIILLPKD
ncbi:MAG: OmpA family protein [Deltaproteobacteria bacterium]|nr:OmpA family protein [Deltaproteobacteria bacterium]